MLQKQMFRSFRLSWRHFDAKTNILKPSSTVICNAILNKNFCTVEPNINKTREISAPVINTPLEDEKVTVEQNDYKTLEKSVPPLKDEKVTGIFPT